MTRYVDQGFLANHLYFNKKIAGTFDLSLTDT